MKDKVYQYEQKLNSMKQQATGYLIGYRDIAMSNPDNVIAQNTLYYLEGLFECIFETPVIYPSAEKIEELKEIL